MLTATDPEWNLFFTDMHCAVEGESIFMFRDQLFILAAVRTPHVLQLNAVELCSARACASVDGKLTFTAVTDLTHSINVLVTVRDLTLKVQ